jgi:RNA polymerase sigma-70 factor (ECF subfamily)
LTIELVARGRTADYEDHLALQAREGDSASFDTLVHRYQPRLLRFAYRMLQDASDAEDVLQSTLIRAYRGLGAYRPGGFFASWLYRIALNECRRLLRARARLPLASEEAALSVAAGPPSDPAAAALAGDRNRLVRAAVMSLPHHYREVVLLFYFEGLSVEQIARAMRISTTATKVRLHRARARLGAALEGAL